MLAVEDSTGGPVTNPSISFLLRQVYYAHRKQVKELEDEIIRLKEMISKQKNSGSLQPCEECKKIKKSVQEEEKKITLFEQDLRKVSEVRHQISERSIGVQTDFHLKSSERTFWKKRSRSNGLSTMTKCTKCVSSSHINYDEDDQPSSSRSNDSCRVPSIREDIHNKDNKVLVPETLTVDPESSFEVEHSQNVTIAHIAETVDDQRNSDVTEDKPKLSFQDSIKPGIVATSSRELSNIVNPVSCVTTVHTSTQKSTRRKLSKSKLQLPISSKSAVQCVESDKEVFSPSPIHSGVLWLKENTWMNVTSNSEVSNQNVPLDISLCPPLFYCDQQEEIYDVELCKNRNDVVNGLSSAVDNLVQEPQDLALIQTSTPELFETKKENLSLNKLSKKLKFKSKYKMELQSPPGHLKKSKLKQTKLSASSFNPASKDLTKIINFIGGLRTDDKALNKSIDQPLKVYKEELSERIANCTSGRMNKQVQKDSLPNNSQTNWIDSRLDETLLPQEECTAILNQLDNQNMSCELSPNVWEDKGEGTTNWNGSMDPAVCLTSYESSMMVNIGTSTSKEMKVPDHEKVVLSDGNQESCSESESSEDLLSAMGKTTPQKNQPEQTQIQSQDASDHTSTLHRVNIPAKHDQSFDIVPKTIVGPHFKYKEDPVRRQDARNQLPGHDCKMCDKYYKEMGLSEEERRQRLQLCSRHRSSNSPPHTPDHYWELDFPNTQECRERGYLKETQRVQLKPRRRRPLQYKNQ